MDYVRPSVPWFLTSSLFLAHLGNISKMSMENCHKFGFMTYADIALTTYMLLLPAQILHFLRQKMQYYLCMSSGATIEECNKIWHFCCNCHCSYRIIYFNIYFFSNSRYRSFR